MGMTNIVLRFLSALVGLSGLAVFCLAVLVLLASPVSAADASSVPACELAFQVGLFDPCADLDPAQIDDLR